MKKTTYIMIVMLALGALGAFVTPRLSEDEAMEIVEMPAGDFSDTTTVSSVALPAFGRIDITVKYDSLGRFDVSRVREGVTFVFVECDTLSLPRLIASPVWLENMTVSVDGGNAELCVDMHTFLKDNDCERYAIIPDSTVLKVAVPKGMLREINVLKRGTVSLSGFKGGDITISNALYILIGDSKLDKVQSVNNKTDGSSYLTLAMASSRIGEYVALIDECAVDIEVDENSFIGIVDVVPDSNTRDNGLDIGDANVGELKYSPTPESSAWIKFGSRLRSFKMD